MIVSKEQSRRGITNPQLEQFTCEQCGQPTTMSCTDAIEVKPTPESESTWTESGMRYGCAQHPVFPMVYYADGREVPFSECPQD